MDKKIKVQVIGPAGSGKSTIIHVIKEALKRKGLEVKFDGGMDFKDEAEFDKYTSMNAQGALIRIKSKSEIVIEEVQANRNENL